MPEADARSEDRVPPEADASPETDASLRLSVKELAQFVHRRGDIHYRYEFSALAAEGIARQKEYQQHRATSYQREVSVEATYGQLGIRGRIDGWDPEARLVEEVKTTRADAKALHARIGAVNTAQLKLYGAMLALADETLGTLRLRLVYLHPDEPTETVVEELLARSELIEFFETTCAVYARWIAETNARLVQRNASLRGLGFPYADFRSEQRLLAKTVYRGFRDAADWLVEAPTGSGKTMATVFPALKAMGEGHLDRVVFVTSRTTGQAAAETAFRDAAADVAAVVVITAKERICFNPGVPCDPDLCEFASGYYDRMPRARRDLLGRRMADREVVEAVARAHRVCPFELSLDTAAWADAVIGDYNYVFDPVVRLKRLDNERFRRVSLIVDEAHQLGDRVRDMLGMCLDRAVVKAALAEQGLPAPLAKGLRSVERALANIAKGASTDNAGVERRGVEREIECPKSLQRAIDRFLGAFSRVPTERDRLPLASEAHFDLLRFQRACDWVEEGAFHCVASGRGRRLRIEIICTVPGNYIQSVLEPFHGSARLSGTLTPARVFQRIHGFSEGADTLCAGGGAPPERLGVFVVPDLRTFYRDRHATLGDLTRLIAGVAGTTEGNTLVAFPSFEYARAAAAAWDHPRLRCQEPKMDLAERAEFIAWISEPGANRIGFVVMGGVFAESVDFDSRALHGVVVVGVGLPPSSLRRDLIATDSVARGVTEDGHEIAYRQPAMTRVVQAVGRIARGDHCGFAVLVDPRFSNPRYSAFMPSWWNPRFVPAHGAPAEVAAFWAG